MARFSGMIGYVEHVPDPNYPSVYVQKVTERRRRGDIQRQASKWQSNQSVNDDLEITNRISIVADEFAMTHTSLMKYVVLHGQRWCIKSVSMEHPRMTLILGGVYNGPTPEGP